MSKSIKNQDVAFLERERGLVLPAPPLEGNVLAVHRAQAVGSGLLTVAILVPGDPEEVSRDLKMSMRMAHYVPVIEIYQVTKTPPSLVPHQFRREGRTGTKFELPSLETTKRGSIPFFRYQMSRWRLFRSNPRFPLL
jgi:hypothetical protein